MTSGGGVLLLAALPLIVGTLTAAVGGTWLSERIGERNGPESKMQQMQHKTDSPVAITGFGFDPRSGSVSLQGRF